MKIAVVKLKTLIGILSLCTSTLAYAQNQKVTAKKTELTQTETLQKLESLGLSGELEGLDSKTQEKCLLRVKSAPAEPEISMRLESAPTEMSQFLVMTEDVSDIAIKATETEAGLSLLQDFSDSSAEMTLNLSRQQKIKIHFKTDIAGDFSELECDFKK